MTVNRIDNIKDAPEKTLSRVVGHDSDGKGGAATLPNLKGQLSITAADVSGAVPETRQIATSGGIQGGGTLDNDLTLSLTDTGVDADTYGSATEIPVITVGADGRVAGAQNLTLSLTNTGVVAGTYGSATAIPVITVGADGRVTGVTTAVAAGVRAYTIMAHQIVASLGTATASTLSGVTQPVPCIDYDASSYEYARVFLPVPKAWDLNAVDVRIGWAPANGNSGNVLWAANSAVVNADDASSNFSTSLGAIRSALSAAPGAVAEMQTVLLTDMIPSGTPAGGSMLLIVIARAADIASDTYAADARLVFVEVLFGVTSNSDA